MKIAYISPFGVQDPHTMSGTAYFIARALNSSVGEVISFPALRPVNVSWGWLLRNVFSDLARAIILGKFEVAFWRMLGKHHHWDRTLMLSKSYARAIERWLEHNPCDVIFVDKASAETACLKTDIPIVYRSDSTFHLMVDYYSAFKNLSPRALKFGEEIERRALNNSRFFVPCSRWAADSAVQDYGVDPEKVKVIHSHAGGVEGIERSRLLRKERNICQLLFIGVEWERKGGDIAVEAVVQLNKMGVPAKLIICGCSVPQEYRKYSFIEEVGFLSKADQRERDKFSELFLSSNFFILPTRAECMGQVYCEASAFGLPAFATDAGGVSDVVVNGRNGYCLPLTATGVDFALKIKEIWQDRMAYERLCLSSKEFYDERLSNNVWQGQMKTVIERVVHSGVH